ncbi:MAG TPA: hypothetical protein VL485_13815 [Ktedonobacteraceae bacterium]|nr:hypothetical protein [Ktedonobacteraceae bacterium]
MYRYDLTRQGDCLRLSFEAEEMGREAARTMPLAERSDVIHARAHQICEQALAEGSQLTNDPAAYTTSFVDAYTDAYFRELVALFHKNLHSTVRRQPETHPS